MKFRIGFVSNSSASSFLVTDRSLDLKTVKKRFAVALGGIPAFASFEIIDEHFMTDAGNNHLDLPFLAPLLKDLDAEFHAEERQLGALRLSDRAESREKTLLKRRYYEKKQRLAEQYIQTDEFKKKYKGLIYFYAYACFEEELLDELLGDIGRYVAAPDPYDPNGQSDPDDNLWDISMGSKMREYPFLLRDTAGYKILRSPGVNYVFDKKTGNMASWGKTPAEDFAFSAVGPFLADVEVTTRCGGLPGRGPCSFCYKSNLPEGHNMPFALFKAVLDLFPPTLTQVALGADATCEANPDIWDMMDYCRLCNAIDCKLKFLPITNRQST